MGCAVREPGELCVWWVPQQLMTVAGFPPCVPLVARAAAWVLLAVKVGVVVSTSCIGSLVGSHGPVAR